MKAKQMKLRAMLLFGAGLLGLLASLQSSRAQVTGATLSGTITDNAKNLVPNASVCSNIGFGDRNMKTLYMACRTSIYKASVKIPGL